MVFPVWKMLMKISCSSASKLTIYLIQVFDNNQPYIYIYIYVYICICVYIYINTHIHTHIYVYLFLCMCEILASIYWLFYITLKERTLYVLGMERVQTRLKLGL